VDHFNFSERELSLWPWKYDGAAIFNVSNPAKPTLIKTFATLGKPLDGVVASNSFYVADDEAGLTVFDVRSSTDPRFVSSFSTPSPAKAVVVAGSRAYVATTSSLLNVNVSDPANPRLTASLPIQRKTRRLCIYKNYIFTAGSYGVEVIDVSNPSKPKMFASYITDSCGDDVAVAVANDHVYFAAGYNNLIILRFVEKTEVGEFEQYR